MTTADPETTGDPDRVQSVETVFAILEYMKDNNGTGITELSSEIGLSKGAIHRYMQTLVSLGYVIKRDGQYDLSLHLLDFGSYARQQVDQHESIESKIEYLAEKTKERAQFIVPEHGRGVYIFRKRGANAVKTDARIGKVVRLHTTAAGKAILAQYSESRVESIIEEHGLPQRTPYTITEKDELLAELETTNERGYAMNKNEHVDGLCAVGVPIHGADDSVIGSISVSGPTNRLFERIKEDQIQQDLLGVANEIELLIEYT